MREALESKLYDQLSVRFLNNENIGLLYENLLNERDPLTNINLQVKDSFLRKSVEDILRRATSHAWDFLGFLSDKKLTETINLLFSKLLEERKSNNNEWAFLSRVDIEHDFRVADPEIKSLFNYDKIESCNEYVSNAWNNVICSRALIKWLKSNIFCDNSHKAIIDVLIDSHKKLEATTSDSINKYPVGIADNLINVHDTAFVAKMVFKINNISDLKSFELRQIDILSHIELLKNNQNDDLGWSSLMVRGDSGKITKVGLSDFGATCYVLLFFLELQKKDKEQYSYLIPKIQTGIDYIIASIKQESGVYRNDEFDIDNTCLAIQVLRKHGMGQEHQYRIIEKLKKLINDNVKYFISDDLSSISQTFKKDPVSQLCLLVRTLLRLGYTVKNPIISLPFAWIIKRAPTEEKSNLVHIICCISDYLEAERSFLLYGESGSSKEKDFI